MHGQTRGILQVTGGAKGRKKREDRLKEKRATRSNSLSQRRAAGEKRKRWVFVSPGKKKTRTHYRILDKGGGGGGSQSLIVGKKKR